MQELREELVARARMMAPDHPDDVEDVVQEVLLSLWSAGRAVLNRRAYAVAALRWRCALLARTPPGTTTVSLDRLGRQLDDMAA